MNTYPSHQYITRPAKVLVFLAAFLAAASVNAAVIVSSTLSGTANATLTGTPATFFNPLAYGAAPLWQENLPGWQFSSAGTSITADSSINQFGNNASTIALPAFTNQTVTLQADLRMAGSTTWTALGFVTTTADHMFSGAPLMVLLQVDGLVQVYQNTTTGNLLSQSISSFDANSFYNLQLNWDRNASTGSVFVNGTQLGSTFSTSGVLNPTIGGAAIHSIGAGLQTTLVQNFEVSAIPEPSTFALIGVSALGISLLRRKRGSAAV